MGGIGFSVGEGLEKNRKMPPTLENPEQYPCANFLKYHRSIGTIFIITEIETPYS